MRGQGRPARAATTSNNSGLSVPHAAPLAEMPTGTLTVLTTDGRVVAYRNADRYEIGDGDLFVLGPGDQRRDCRAGSWVAVGRLERADGLTYVAIEAFAEAAA